MIEYSNARFYTEFLRVKNLTDVILLKINRTSCRKRFETNHYCPNGRMRAIHIVLIFVREIIPELA